MVWNQGGKNRYLVAVILVVLLTILAGCAKKEQPAATTEVKKNFEAQEIRIAIQPGPQMAPIYVVKQKGWLEKELSPLGVSVKWTTFLSGPPMNESFAAGQQDIGFMGDTPAIVAKASGQDTRIVGIDAAGPHALAVVVPKNSGIKSASDLKGKKVSVVKGSYAHHLLVLVLQQAGLTTSDIQLINLPQADSGTALARGDVAAAAIWEPLITNLQSQGAIRILQDGAGIKKGDLVIIANNDFATRNPQLVEALLKAYQRGYENIKENPQQAAQLIASDINLPPDKLAQVLQRLDFNPALHPDDIAELKKSAAFLQEAGLIQNPVDIDAFIDRSYLEQAGIK